MTLIRGYLFRERIDRILQETRGKSVITDWERQRLTEWSGKAWISAKQGAIVGEIERRVFGSEK